MTKLARSRADEEECAANARTPRRLAGATGPPHSSRVRSVLRYFLTSSSGKPENLETRSWRYGPSESSRILSYLKTCPDKRARVIFEKYVRRIKGVMYSKLWKFQLSS
ncbi:hypothetical protein KM043_014582 [Ampulex compressa]|nr:hypothetical protein KM043_014582 [Ampulex compressa]